MIPSNDFIEWLFATVDWTLSEVLLRERFFEEPRLVAPTFEDFPVDASLEGDALVADYFAFVEEHAGTTELDWDLELVPNEPASPAAILNGMPHAMTGAVEGGGLLLAEGDPLPIEYAPGLERDPEMLVAVLSRGLSHWLCACCGPHRGDDDDFHFAVDVVWVFTGFGVFASRCAFRTSAQEQGALVGWGTQRFGALGPLELAYTLGLYAELLGLDHAVVDEHLTTNGRAWVRDARKDLRRRHGPRVMALRATGGSDGPYRT